MKLPNRWGGGQLFAFSGIDGETDWAHPLTGSTLDEEIGFAFHTEPPRRVWIEIGPGFHQWTFELVASDIVDVTCTSPEAPEVSIRATYLFLDRGTVLGRFVARNDGLKGRQMDISVCAALDGNGSSRIEEGVGIVQGDGVARSIVMMEGTSTAKVEKSTGILSQSWMVSPGEEHSCRFVFAIDFAGRKEWTDVQNKMSVDFEELLRKRRAYFERLPGVHGVEDHLERTYYKAFSALKANVETAQGRIKHRWTTPDRWPHRHMWLWDSAFQSLAYRYIAPDLGQDALLAVLSTQREDGFISITMTPEGRNERLTQPPLLAWAVWEVYQFTGDQRFLRTCYPKLKAYVEWDRAHRDANGNGLLEWVLDTASEHCHCGESGMDNSPRFDEGNDADHIDLSCFVANEMDVLSEMAGELKMEGEVGRWREEYERIRVQIQTRLWDPQDRFFYDRALDGPLIKIKSAASFLPLFAGVATAEQAEALVEHLTDGRTFWRPFPVASVAADEPKYCDDMWRGPTWINYNYLIIRGLRRYGYAEIAEELTRKTIHEIARWYEKAGSIFEYYDAEGRTPPKQLTRKRGTYLDVISDYGWSAAIYIQLMRDA